MRILATLVACLALLGAVTACQNTVSSVDLHVGDCFNYTNTTDANGDPVNVPAPVDCAKTHSDEVSSVFDHPNVSGFPGYEQIGALRQTQCQADFKAYVGVDWEASEYSIAYISPEETTWAAGDHAIHCLLEDSNGGNLTGSARGTKK